MKQDESDFLLHPLADDERKAITEWVKGRLGLILLSSSEDEKEFKSWLKNELGKIFYNKKKR